MGPNGMHSHEAPYSTMYSNATRLLGVRTNMQGAVSSTFRKVCPLSNIEISANPHVPPVLGEVADMRESAAVWPIAGRKRDQ